MPLLFTGSSMQNKPVVSVVTADTTSECSYKRLPASKMAGWNDEAFVGKPTAAACTSMNLDDI